MALSAPINHAARSPLTISPRSIAAEVSETLNTSVSSIRWPSGETRVSTTYTSVGSEPCCARATARGRRTGDRASVVESLMKCTSSASARSPRSAKREHDGARQIGFGAGLGRDAVGALQ